MLNSKNRRECQAAAFNPRNSCCTSGSCWVTVFLPHLRARTRPCTLAQVHLPLNETQRSCQVFLGDFRTPVSFPDSALPSSLSLALIPRPCSCCTKNHLLCKANIWLALALLLFVRFLLCRSLRPLCGTPGESEAQLFLRILLG